MRQHRTNHRQRRYTPEDRACALAALSANGGNQARTARQLGIPRITLRAWATGFRHAEARAAAEPVKAALADHLEGVAHRLLEALSARIAAASLRDLALLLGIAVDRMIPLAS